jgi:hypothetical protein
MEEQVFDAAAFARFDLNAGEIRSVEDGVLLMLPPEVASAIVPSPEAVQASRQWGLLHGRGLHSTLEIRGGEAGMELLSQHLCGTVAVLGFGRLTIEVHGSALLFRVPSSGPAGRSAALSEVLQGFLAGYLEGLSKDRFEVTRLGEAEGHLLLLAGSEAAAEAAKRLVLQGKSALEIVQHTLSWRVA